jgi:arylsulfatase A-like enzyme
MPHQVHKRSETSSGDRNLISRRSALKWFATATIACGASRLAFARDASSEKFNIILILCDDLGVGELGCYGNGNLPTPNLDTLATDGVKFAQAYSCSCIGSPARAGMLTGRYPARFGNDFNPGTAVDPDFGFNLDEVLISQVVKDAGYTTGMIGKWFGGMGMDHHPLSRGFDEFFGFLGGAHSYIDSNTPTRDPIRRNKTPLEKEPEYLTDAFTREALDFIVKHHEKPFFLYLAYNALHSPLQAPEKYTDRFKEIADPDRRLFAGMLTALDEGVGRITQKLRDLKIDEKTLVIFLSSNGGPTTQTTSRNSPLRGQKAGLFEGGIRIPMIFWMPTRISANRTIDDPVINLDIAPTIAALAGGNMPNDRKIDGENILPLARGENVPSPHETLYWRLGDMWAIRKGKYKLHRRTLMGKPMLFDLQADEREGDEISATFPQVVQELSQLHDQWDAQMPAQRRDMRKPATQP